MSVPRQPRYDVELRVAGDAAILARALFGDDVQCTVEPVATTIVVRMHGRGEIAELCHRVRDSGLQLIALRRLAGGTTDATQDGPAP